MYLCKGANSLCVAPMHTRVDMGENGTQVGPAWDTAGET